MSAIDRQQRKRVGHRRLGLGSSSKKDHGRPLISPETHDVTMILHPTPKNSRNDWIRYGKYIVDTVTVFDPVARQLKTILPAYHAADALWEYYKAYEKGGPPAVVETYAKDRAVEALTDLQTEATWNLVGADKFVPPTYKQPARAVLSGVMTKISEKEVDFIEGYLERRTSS